MTKKQANQIAKLYISSLFVNYDNFNCDNLSEEDKEKVQTELDKITRNLVKDICFDVYPTTSDTCVDIVMKGN